jgi:hypothetical protein
MASAKQPNDQKDPAASASSSSANCAENGLPSLGCFLESQEPTKISLIDDWIDA